MQIAVSLTDRNIRRKIKTENNLWENVNVENLLPKTPASNLRAKIPRNLLPETFRPTPLLKLTGQNISLITIYSTKKAVRFRTAFQAEFISSRKGFRARREPFRR